MIPIKNSKKWIIVFICYTIVIWIGLLITRAILNIEFSGRYIISMLFISLGSAIIPCICGYFGKRIFFIIYTLAVIAGILYMFYVVLGDIAPGWGDLTSIIGYLFIIGIGAILALLAEFVIYITKISTKK